MKFVFNFFKNIFYLRIGPVVGFILITLIFIFSSSCYSQRVAVVPFENLNKDEEVDFLSSGMCETLEFGLENISSLIVLRRDQIEQILKEQAFGISGFVNEETAPKVGKLLSAEIIVIGSFQKIGNLIRIDARFVRLEGSEIEKVFVESVRGKYEEIFDLQHQLALKFIGDFNLTVSEVERERLSKSIKATDSLTAYSYYVKGRNEHFKATLEGYNKAIENFNKALEEDNNFAFAYCGLSEVYAMLGVKMRQVGENPQSYYQNAIGNANKAIEIAPDLPESYRALALAYHQAHMKSLAEKWERVALEYLPNDPELWFMLACWAETQQQMNMEATVTDPDSPYLKKALELNPKFVTLHYELARLYFELKRNVEALRELSLVFEVSPNHFEAHALLVQVYINTENYKEAVNEIKIMEKLEPDSPYVYGAYGILYQKLGRKEDAIKYFEKCLAKNPKFPGADSIRKALKELYEEVKK